MEFLIYENNISPGFIVNNDREISEQTHCYCEYCKAWYVKGHFNDELECRVKAWAENESLDELVSYEDDWGVE